MSWLTHTHKHTDTHTHTGAAAAVAIAAQRRHIEERIKTFSIHANCAASVNVSANVQLQSLAVNISWASISVPSFCLLYFAMLLLLLVDNLYAFFILFVAFLLILSQGLVWSKQVASQSYFIFHFNFMLSYP